MSVGLLVSRMRASNRRRWISMVMPMKQVVAENAADHDRHHLLGFRAQAEGVVDLGRRQEAEEVAEEQAEDADVEQDAAPDQLLAPQQLARLGPPGVLAAIEARPAAEEEGHHAKIRVEAEQELIEVGHLVPLRSAVVLAPDGGAKRATMADAAEQPGPAAAPGSLPKVTGASSQARSSASGVSSGASPATVSRIAASSAPLRCERLDRPEHRGIGRHCAARAARAAAPRPGSPDRAERAPRRPAGSRGTRETAAGSPATPPCRVPAPWRDSGSGD